MQNIKQINITALFDGLAVAQKTANTTGATQIIKLSDYATPDNGKAEGAEND